MNVLPKGPPAHAAIQTFRWMRQPLPFLEECAHRYGDIFTIRLLGFRPVILSNPEAIKEVFAGNPRVLFAGQANIVLKPFLGQHSLLLLDGDEHLRQRRLILPAFHGERMQAYGRTMMEAAHASIDTWPTGDVFPLHRPMQRITLQIILRTVFGIDEGERFRRLSELLSKALDIVAWPPLLLPAMQRDLGPLSPWGRFLRLYAEAAQILYAEMRQRRESGTAGRTDVLSMMMAARDENGAALSDEELRDELVTLLVAGHETTATALCWAFRWLLSDPVLHERLLDEIASAFEGGQLVPEKVARLELLDGAVRETLRLSPVIPLVGRVLQEPLRVLGHDLPAGTVLAPCIYLTQRRASVYPDPERFDPERYRNFKPGAAEWFPFGGGVRRCIGAAFATYEMKMVLATILSRTTLALRPGYRPRVVRRSITLTPAEGLPVIVSSVRARPYLRAA
jgi:cytochrome P450